jgi:hypothetical protein
MIWQSAQRNEMGAMRSQAGRQVGLQINSDLSGLSILEG